MRLLRIILIWMVLAGAPLAGLCGGITKATPEGEPAAQGEAGKEETELSAYAVPLWDIKGVPVIGHFPITNSMLVTWVVALGVIIFAQVATRNMKLVPEGAQNFWEWMVESLYDFLASILGPDLVKRTFWFFITIFIFILFTNWVGLVPGVGTILVSTPEGMKPLLRGGNADLNMTFAMAAIFMVLWLIWALRSNGIWGFTLHIFGPKGDSTGFIKYLMILIFFAVGFIEVISIAFRPISLSFRLYGNIFAGESLLEAMSRTVQHPAWAKAVFSVLLPVPFYFLEILVGLIQAFVFMLLTTVFTALICTHEEEHAKEHH
jgi:F-type H+-transporting ATPase subunit a